MNKRISYTKIDSFNYFAMLVATSMLAQLLLAFVPQQLAGRFWVVQAVYTVILGTSAVVYSAIGNANFLKVTKLNAPPKALHTLFAVLCTVLLLFVMVPVNDAFLSLIEGFGLNRPSVDIPMDNLPLLIIVVCVLPAFAEEFAFRGTIANGLFDEKSYVGAIFLTGGLFALFHTNPAQTLHQFLLGTLLALCLVRGGSLWTTIIAHFVNNLATVVMYFTLGESAFYLENVWLFAAVAAVLLASALFVYIRFVKRVDVQNSSQRDDVFATKRLSAASLVGFFVAVGVCVALWVAVLLS